MNTDLLEPDKLLKKYVGANGDARTAARRR